MKVEIKLITRNGATPAMPKYETAGAAALDLAAFIPSELTIPAEGHVLIPTGLQLNIPSGYCGLLFARSGLASKHGVGLANGVGLIDSDYRGEIMLAMQNQGREDFTIQNGDRIAQIMIAPAEHVELLSVAEMSESPRQAGGFGSTGR